LYERPVTKKLGYETSRTQMSGGGGGTWREKCQCPTPAAAERPW